MKHIATNILIMGGHNCKCFQGQRSKIIFVMVCEVQYYNL